MKQFFKIFLLTIVLLSNGQALRAQIYFHGRIVDSKQIPLSGVSCVLINLSDSTQIDGTASDMDGRFILTSKVDEEYLLQLSFIGYEKIRKICKSGNLGDIVLHEDAVLLDELTVTPQILNTIRVFAKCCVSDYCTYKDRKVMSYVLEVSAR